MLEMGNSAMDAETAMMTNHQVMGRKGGTVGMKKSVEGWLDLGRSGQRQGG